MSDQNYVITWLRDEWQELRDYVMSDNNYVITWWVITIMWLRDEWQELRDYVMSEWWTHLDTQQEQGLGIIM